MDQILEFLTEQNGLSSSVLVGGIFSLLGLVVAMLLVMFKQDLRLKKKIVFPATIALFALIGAAGISPIMMNRAHQAKLDKQVKEVITNFKVLESIFSAHPEAEDALRVLLVKSKTKEAIADTVNEFSIKQINKYFFPNIIQASNSILRHYLLNSGQILYALQEEPAECFEYFANNTLSKSSTLVSEDLLKAEYEIKSTVIIEGLANEDQVSLISKQDAMNKIYTKYQEHGYDPNDIQRLFARESLTPRDGCDVALRFTYTLAKMEDDGAQVLKTLIYYQLNPDAK